MTPLTVPYRELDEILAALCDNTAGPAEIARLESLADDAGALSYILDYLQMDGLLRWENEAGATDPQQPAIPCPAPSASTQQPNASLGFLGVILHTAGGYDSSGWPVAYLVATVILGLGLVVGAVTHISRPKPVAGTSAPAANHEFEPATKMLFVGRITGMVDCQWEDASTEAVNGAYVPLGRKYALASGLMEITYDSGARVILQGPVTYEVESPVGGYLSVGKLTAKLEKRSEVRGQRSKPANQKSEIRNHQFSVRTPTATVTDLGTEFGVEVDKGGTTQTHVFRGSIELLSRSGDGQAATPSHVLREGESARIESNRVTKTHLDTTQFVRTLQVSTASIHADTYATLVLSMQPAAYYRMEPAATKKSRDIVFDSASGGHHGALSFSDEYRGQPYGVGRVGRSLQFRGQMTGDHAIVPDYPKTTNGQLTVSAWVMAKGRSQWPMIAANWAEGKINGHECTGQFHFGLHWDGEALAVGITQRNGQFVKLYDRGSQSFRLGMWQHVAFVADGANLRLYRDGVEVASTPCAGILPNPTVACLGIGCKTNPLGTGVASAVPGYWQGWIDELAIFNKAISAAEIRRLAAGNKRGVSNDDAATREGSGNHQR